jgi:hypothetical protein
VRDGQMKVAAAVLKGKLSSLREELNMAAGEL